MDDNGFSRKDLRKEVAKGDLNIETKTEGNVSEDFLKYLMNHQYKMNMRQYILAFIMMVVGIAVNFIKKDGIGITIGSLAQGDINVSNITVNLGALLILGSLFIIYNITKNSNINFKNK